MFNAIVIRSLEIAVFFGIGIAIEHHFPARGGVTFRSRAFNLCCSLLFEGFSLSAGVLFASTVGQLVRKAPFHDLIYTGNDHGSFLMAFALVLFQLCIADFFYYWIHRLILHGSLWSGCHALHHADEHMNVTTAKRVHWFENPLQTIFGSVPTILLFKPPIVTIGMAFVLADAIPYFVHMDARIDIGWLKRIFVNPQTHRIHHSREPQHFDKNFASHFAFWDVLFGTYYYPEQGEWPETGIPGTSVSARDFLLPPLPSR